MATSKFNTTSYLTRLLAAAALVFATYNPLESWSYFGWAIRPAFSDFSMFTPVQGLVGVVLLIGWVILIRATHRSLGLIGILLGALLCAMIVWVMIDHGWIQIGENELFQWVMLAAISVLLGTGLSWSHIRRRISGQLDVDDIDSE